LARRLHALRTDPRYGEAFTTPDPLVSVIIPTWNRLETLIERAIPSALGQTHPNIEVIVVGDASPPEIGAAIEALNEPRVVFHNLTIRGPYSDSRYGAWLASGTPGINAGVAMAHGLWIAPLEMTMPLCLNI
jgi:glycosyltransferase involved in cell wall biosynthesis